MFLISNLSISFRRLIQNIINQTQPARIHQAKLFNELKIKKHRYFRPNTVIQEFNPECFKIQTLFKIRDEPVFYLNATHNLIQEKINYSTEVIVSSCFENVNLNKSTDIDPVGYLNNWSITQVDTGVFNFKNADSEIQIDLNKQIKKFIEQQKIALQKIKPELSKITSELEANLPAIVLSQYAYSNSL